MITLKYGPLHSITTEAGQNVSGLKAQIIRAFDLEVDAEDLSAHCVNGNALDNNNVPEDGATIVFRNSEPARKGDLA